MKSNVTLEQNSNFQTHRKNGKISRLKKKLFMKEIIECPKLTEETWNLIKKDVEPQWTEKFEEIRQKCQEKILLLLKTYLYQENNSLKFGIYAPFRRADSLTQSLVGLTYSGEMFHHRYFGEHPLKPLDQISEEEQTRITYFKDWEYLKKIKSTYPDINMTFMLYVQPQK